LTRSVKEQEEPRAREYAAGELFATGEKKLGKGGELRLPARHRGNSRGTARKVIFKETQAVRGRNLAKNKKSSHEVGKESSVWGGRFILWTNSLYKVYARDKYWGWEEKLEERRRGHSQTKELN